MERLTDFRLLGGRQRPIVLAAGYLDGLHLGHRAVLDAAVREAADLGGEAWVLTVDPHPMKILRPDRAPTILTDLESRLRLIARTGVTGCVILPFTPALAALEPETFLDELTRGIPNLRRLVVGTNWRFGHGARGDVALLRNWTPGHSLSLRVLEPVLWRDRPISSTRIRTAIEAGDLAEANAMLGRPFSVRGVVEHGRGVGRKLGFPTANLLPANEVRPAPGVYAVRVSGAGPDRFGAAYYGPRPTFDDGGPAALEIYLLDFDLDLYGKEMEAHFLERIRGSLRFDSPSALQDQIRRDVDRVRELATGA
jgi:riboflavin kinase/FMN adenylyltransferase